MKGFDVQFLLKETTKIAKQAGLAILNYVGKDEFHLQVTRKKDHSPLTAADLAAHRIIAAGLAELTPEWPILSEEGALPSFIERQSWERYWLVDPLDGTRGFIAGSLEFSVNIALIEQDKPILGVIYAPTSKICYYAARGLGSFKEGAEQETVALTTVPFDWNHFGVLLGHYLGTTRVLRIFEKIPECSIHRLNSSLKFCRLAEGGADIYPRLGETGEWDTAAGQCILEESGGCVVDFANQPLRYNRKNSLINPPFLALGDPTQADKIIQFIDMRRNV